MLLHLKLEAALVLGRNPWKVGPTRSLLQCGISNCSSCAQAAARITGSLCQIALLTNSLEEIIGLEPLLSTRLLTVGLEPLLLTRFRTVNFSPVMRPRS